MKRLYLYLKGLTALKIIFTALSVRICTWPIYILFAFFMSSCNGQFSSFQRSTQIQRDFGYCDLLYVTPGPYQSSSPKPFLGITFEPKKIDRNIAGCKNNTFLQITDVISGTPAMEAGLKKGDIILSINSNPVCGEGEEVSRSIKDMIAKQEIGSLIELAILRGNEELNFVPVLGRMPSCSRPSAEHPEVDRCFNNPQSMLETSLRDHEALPLFNRVISGLYQQSNYAQNLQHDYENACDPFQLKEFSYMVRHPLDAGVVARELSERFIAETGKKDVDFDKVMRNAARLLDVEVETLPRKEEITLPALITIMARAEEKVEHSFSRLTTGEKALLRQLALEPSNDDRWNTFLNLSMKVDLKELFDAFSPVLSFLSGENLSLLKEDLMKRFAGKKDPILFEEMTPAGKVIVGGPGPNVYKEDAALILDLGGDDLYLNNAGGTRPGMPIAIVVDWEGNDHYLSRENFSQGAGLMGGGFLIDLSDSDTFEALDGAQGAGFFGMGMLYHGDGPGIIKGRKSCQGVGQMGIGLLWNGKGDTVYSCSLEGQALGFFKGAGILIDEAGNDYYQLGGLEPDFRDPQKATVSMGQGFAKGLRQEGKKDGVSGGIGLLIDESGNDTYIADYFAQGASYYYGIGILNDLSGDDRYIAGRYAQGAGIHSSVGVLLDQSGNDFYYASFGVAQGMGHDYGVGFFEDDQGDDYYWGGRLVQGAATKGSMGIFMDIEGKNRYMCDISGQGFAETADSMAIMIANNPADGPKNVRDGKVSVRLGLRSADQ